VSPTEPRTLPEVFREVIAELLAHRSEDEDHGQDSTAARLVSLQEEAFSRVFEASGIEIEEGLYVFWRVMRNVSREECWYMVPTERRTHPTLREEIREKFEADKQRSEQMRALVGPHEMEEAVRASAAIVKGREVQVEGIRELVSELWSQLRRGPDPLEASLPNLPDSDPAYDDYRRFLCPTGWADDGDIISDALWFLKELIEPIRLRVGESEAFWGVLGVMEDALQWDDSRGFREEIERGGLFVLKQVTNGYGGDMWDYLMLLERETEATKRRDVERRMFDYMTGAPVGEIEAAFRALDLQFTIDVEEPAERRLCNAENLWRRVVGSGRETRPMMTRWMLARAGYFFWSSSPRHYGEPRCLAALGIAYEGNMTIYLPELKIYPFMALWAAARDAAAAHRWVLAEAYLVRALIDINIWAEQMADGEYREEVESFDYDVRFVDELLLRAEGPEMLQVGVFLAESALQRAGVQESSEVYRSVRWMATRAGLSTDEEEEEAGDEAEGIAVETTMSSREVEISGLVSEETWEIVELASEFWRMLESRSTGDYSAVGVCYRRAIEREWRRRLFPVMEQFWKKRPGPTTSLGDLLLLFETDTQVDRGKLARHFREGSRLLQPEFVEVARDIIRELNPAAHARGLSRQECIAIREKLLDDGLLWDLLESVQPPGG
jgi:hypothetical protein